MFSSSDFVSHFEELRKRILISLSLVILISIGCFFFAGKLLDFIIWPLTRAGAANQLFFHAPQEAFIIHVKAALFFGILISSPVIFFHGWRFAAPGLYENEKKVFGWAFPLSALLFLCGAAFSFFLILPWSLEFLLNFRSARLAPLLEAGPYFSFLVTMIFGFGLVFDFPVLMVGLVKLGLIKAQTLCSLRRPMIVLIFILAAVLTPSPDPVSQLLLAIPLLLLFEIAVWVAHRVEIPPQTPPEASHVTAK